MLSRRDVHSCIGRLFRVGGRQNLLPKKAPDPNQSIHEDLQKTISNYCFSRLCTHDDPTQGISLILAVKLRYAAANMILRPQTMLNCIDNSGAAVVECVNVLKKKSPATIGTSMRLQLQIFSLLTRVAILTPRGCWQVTASSSLCRSNEISAQKTPQIAALRTRSAAETFVMRLSFERAKKFNGRMEVLSNSMTMRVFLSTSPVTLLALV